jgi:hypothetical protein
VHENALRHWGLCIGIGIGIAIKTAYDPDSDPDTGPESLLDYSREFSQQRTRRGNAARNHPWLAHNGHLFSRALLCRRRMRSEPQGIEQPD